MDVIIDSNNGSYIFRTVPTNYKLKLIISATGYKTQELNFTAKENLEGTLGKNTYDFSLSKAVKVCDDSSVVCENLNNQKLNLVLPAENKSKSLDIKFNNRFTLSGKIFVNSEELCNSSKEPNTDIKSLMNNIYVKNYNGKVSLYGNSTSSGEYFVTGCGVPGDIVKLEFYDLGLKKIDEIKTIEDIEYKSSLSIEEGHTYAVKVHYGYIDFTQPSVSSYIFVEKITDTQIKIILNSSEIIN